MESKQDLGLFARIFRKKNPDQLMNDAKKNSLKRTLGAFDLTILGIGAIIGAGIFTLAGTAAAGGIGHLGAGPGLMLSFVFAGISCALAALCYAEFAAMIPVAGSAYTYTFATLGELAAWLIGWILLLEYAIGNITVACGWSGYLFQFLEGFDKFLPGWLVHPPLWLTHDYHSAMLKYQSLNIANPESHIPHLFGIPFCINLPALLIIFVIVGFLYKGVQESTKMAAIMVAVKLVVIMLFIGAGAFYVKPENWTPFLPNGFHSVFVGAFLVFFAYIGFDAVSTAAEETKNPQKDLPIGIIASLAVCTVLYIVVAAVLTGMVPWNHIDIHAPIAAALRYVQNPLADKAAGIVALGAVAGLTSVLLVMQLGATRIMFAMSRDKLLPSVFSKVHKKFNTPHVVTVISGLFVAIGTIFLDLDAAAKLCNIGTLAAFLIVCLGVIILRHTDPDRKRHFRVPSLPIWLAFGFAGALIGGVAISLMLKVAPAVLDKVGILNLVLLFTTVAIVAGLICKYLKVKLASLFAVNAIPVFGIITCLGLIILGVPATTLIYFSVWIGLGLIIYFAYGYRKTNEAALLEKAQMLSIEEQQPIEG